VQFASSSVSLAEDALHHSLLDEREGQMHQIESAAKLANDPTLAVVVADDLYLPMAYYTSADLQSEVFAVADPSSNLTLDDNLRALRHYAPLQVEDYGNFVSSHRDFLLIADDDPESTWPTNRLIQDGFAVTLISHASPEQENEVYRVTRK
jgi:hypothetical protein